VKELPASSAGPDCLQPLSVPQLVEYWADLVDHWVHGDSQGDAGRCLRAAHSGAYSRTLIGLAMSVLVLYGFGLSGGIESFARATRGQAGGKVLRLAHLARI
jgi:hypothetical protein